MFFVFEGIDGSGKSSQAARLEGHFRRCGVDVLLVREPGGTTLGEELRRLLLDPGSGELAPETELFLFMAARSHLVKTVVRPALESQRVVIADRFLWSTVVYQGFAAGLDPDEILRIGRTATHGIQATRTFVIDVDPDTAFRRVRDPNRMENRGIEFQRRVREGFLALAGRFRESSVVLDGSGTPDEVHAEVLAHLPECGR